MKHQINSFRFAFRGIWYAIKNESHMRFHIVAAVYVIVFSFFFDLTKSQWAVVLVVIASVIAAELFNSSLEELCDLNTQNYDPLARVAKDIAAGAVLVLSIVAVAIAFIIYFDLEKIGSIALFFFKIPVLAVLFAVSLIISVMFIALGPLGFQKFYHKLKSKK